MLHFSKPLPGAPAQIRMASLKRAITLAESPTRDASHAAVMVLLEPANAGNTVAELMEWKVLLTRRSEYTGVHSGQVAFPGGRCEKGDCSWWETACRETYEEVGLHCDFFEQVGALSDMYIPPSNFLVHPFLAVNKGNQPLRLDAREVADYRNIPLGALDPEKAALLDFGDGQGGPYEAPAWVVDGFVIWGATAMILAELYAVVSGGGLERV